ncbi:MAG: multidrug transporter AcrB [Betaproteobacteria bacterium RIFCSPLOWO2_12_FULL_62_58]|nr:MAG: multidrug transporter AcrB [Betaproteobacteria bacterium RIFCSPLOWO2_12_FULL_62_58]
MFLPELSIRRPVLATVMSLLIVLVGVISFLRLTVREYPKIDSPVVSVRTVYKGASPQVIESQVTQPLEDSISGIEGVKTLKSVSREEVSQITVEFVSDRNPDAAANDVRDRVSRVRGQLPDEVDEPIIAKVEADAQAILWLRLFSNRHSALEISDYADRYVADRLKTLAGVASVIIGGERRYAMRIWLDRERLAAYRLTPQDVEDALRRQNVEVPAGRIESSNREFTVLSETDLRTPEQFNQLIVREVNGYPVRLKDVGRAELGPQDERNIVRVNGNPAVGLGIVKQSTANTLGVARAVKNELPRIRDALPSGMDVGIAFDTSVFIEESIKSVYEVMVAALALVVLVIFFFLRSTRATLIPFVTIPVSLIGAFFLVWLMGFTINVLTLLGIVLAIGLVVDDAIVVLENIHRHIEEGMEPLQAAFRGSREIAFAVVAMTMTLAAVFAPLAFSTGNTGRLFMEFALTVASAVVVSGFLALTLTPMLCSKLLRRRASHGRVYNALERFFHGVSSGYRRTLTWSLGHRVLVVGAFAAVAMSGGVLFKTLKSELSPLEDRGYFIGVMIAPEGATMDYTDQYAKIWEQIYSDVPEIVNYFVVVAPGLDRPNPVNFALSFVRLRDWSERDRKTQQITASLAPTMFATMPGVLAFPINPPSLGQSFRNPPLQFVVQGNSYDELDRMANALMAKARGFPGLANIDSDLKLNKPQLAVDINRDKASAVGVQVEAIGRTLETLLGGRQVTRFKREGKQYDVIVKLEDKDRRQPADLTSIYVRSVDGRLNQLANLVTVTETVAPKELNHFNRLRAAIIQASITPGYTLSEALAFMDKAAAEVLTAEYQTTLDGQSREFRESGQELWVVFALALAFIYLVLSAQFESFRGPLVIMLTVPLAMTGALAAMTLAGVTLNVYSQIGLVMLIGLITKNGILIVEFTNQLRDRGMEKIEALIEASALRLRPILMTSAATILGTVPLAVAAGAGAESRSAIGWVVVGGMTLGTLFTLYVIPTAYTFIVGERALIAEEDARGAGAAGGAAAPPTRAPASKV